MLFKKIGCYIHFVVQLLNCGQLFAIHGLLSLHTVHGVFQARILGCVAIFFSSGPHFVGTLHYDLSVLGGPAWHGSELH